jgi:hypothetical protein
VVKANGISTTLLKLPKRVRHIPMLFKDARTHAIKSLSIASPQFLIIPRCLNVRLCSPPLGFAGTGIGPSQHGSNSQPSSVKLVANRLEI